MRLPLNLKYFLLFILAIGMITLGTIYLPKLIPEIGDILTGLITVGMIILVVFVFVKPFFTFLYARADGIFAVYPDKSEKGLHIFSYHLNPSGDGMDGTRDIQHYFVLTENGKLFYNRLFSHDMTPADGRSGWGDFYSFEESVLQSNSLPKSLERLSAKTHMQLALGPSQKDFGGESWTLFIDHKQIDIKKYSNVADEGYSIITRDTISKEMIWKKKI